MTYKDTWFLRLTDSESGATGMGECALFAGLGCDDLPDYEDVLRSTCRAIERGEMPALDRYPSIKFGVETALADLRSGGCMQPFGGKWYEGREPITINGLVWMGSANLMMKRVEEKLNAGFRCLKMKIGGVDFESELEILRTIRSEFDPASLELRLDANGAFTPDNALERLDRLARFDVHSLEQPVKAGQPEAMARICRESPISIALDEELIGVMPAERERLLDAVNPQYIILKPSLCGGFEGADRWIELAELRGIGWWATSALESNVGLNAIAAWVAAKNPSLPQGLGTGMLYTDNIISPLRLCGHSIVYDPNAAWDIPQLPWISV